MNEIEAGMKRIRELTDAATKGYNEGWQKGYDKGRQDAQQFTCYAFCAALALALNDLHKFGKQRVVRVLNLAGKYMFESFTSREIMEEAYRRIGFEFADDPMSGDLVQEVDG